MTIFVSLTNFGAWAKDSAKIEVTYAPEFAFPVTLPNKRTLDIKTIEYALLNHLVANQPPGAKFKHVKPMFRSPNGWEFVLQQDPGVFEIKMDPLTVAQSTQFASDIQDAIFVTFYNHNSFPSLFLGGGHINVGVEALLHDPLLLFNFVVDLFNQNQMYMGIFGYDTNNALAYPLASDHVQQAIAKTIREWGARIKMEMARNPPLDRRKFLSREFLRSMGQQQKRHADYYSKAWGIDTEGDRFSIDRYNAINFLKSVNSGFPRIELRAVRPQPNYQTWLRQIRLIDGRINNYLAKLTEPLELKLAVPLQSVSSRSKLLTPPVDPKLAIEAHRRYVEESGDNINEQMDYIWPGWQENVVDNQFVDKPKPTLNRIMDAAFESFYRNCERILTN